MLICFLQFSWNESALCVQQVAVLVFVLANAIEQRLHEQCGRWNGGMSHGLTQVEPRKMDDADSILYLYVECKAVPE